MPPGIAISIMAQLLSFLLTPIISGFLALISLSHWIITFFIFNNTFWNIFILFSLLFRLYFPHDFQWTILTTISCLLVYSFCANISHSLTIWNIVSLFVLHILQSGDWAVLSLLYFHIVWSICLFMQGTEHGFRFNFKVSFFNSASSCSFSSVDSDISLTNCPYIIFFP